MAIVSPSLLVITLKVNELNSPIKRYGLVEWIKNQNQLYVVYETHFRTKDR